MNLMNRIEILNYVYKQCFFTVNVWHILLCKKLVITIMIILYNIQIIKLNWRNIGKIKNKFNGATKNCTSYNKGNKLGTICQNMHIKIR